MTVITAHQANYLPGVNVIDKIRLADAVIWLDEVLYSPGGWSNRNKMPDGSWLTVPVEGVWPQPLNRVRISEHGNWRRRHERTLRQHYGSTAEPILAEIERPYGLLIGLNLACLRVLIPETLGGWHFQSHLDGGHAVVAVSDERQELAPISERLARMVAELGGTIYLSGPSGFRYLDEAPFAERGIVVRYWDANGGTECCMSRLGSHGGIRG